MRGMGFGGKYRLSALGLCIFVLSPVAWADGGFLSKAEKAAMAEPVQKAVLLFRDGVEDLILQVKYEGEGDEFAWLVPLPARPEVTVAEEGLFEEIEAYVAERSKWKVYYDPPRYLSRGMLGGGRIGAAEEAVTVHEFKRVGVYEIAVLEADSAEDLLRWCKDHGYHVNTKAREVLKSYVDKGWIFTAMRIHPEASGRKADRGLSRGTIQPVHFTFPTHEAVYPLRISSINEGATNVELYLLAKDTLVNPEFFQLGPSLEEFQARKLALAVGNSTKLEAEFAQYFDADRFTYRAVSSSELPVVAKSLPRWADSQLHITTAKRNFLPEQMVEDVYFKLVSQMGPKEQLDFVESAYGTAQSAVVRMPDAFFSVLDKKLARITDGKSVNSSTWMQYSDQFIFLAEYDRGAHLEKAARHPVPRVRRLLSSFLWQAYFDREAIVAPYDLAIEDYGKDYRSPGLYRGGGGWSSGIRFSSTPGAPQFVVQRALVELFRHPDPDIEVAKLLAALGTKESIALLIGAVRNPLGVGSVHQNQALLALRHVKDPAVRELYIDTLETQRSWLSENEINACLVGLWNNLDPNMEPLVRSIGEHCRVSDMPSGQALARNLLVNGLGVEVPKVEVGMSRDALEAEMGGKGIVLSCVYSSGAEWKRYWADEEDGDKISNFVQVVSRRSGGVNSALPDLPANLDIAVCQWGSGAATFKRDALVSWKAGAYVPDYEIDREWYMPVSSPERVVRARAISDDE
ncbi:MAG: DUF2330 domain-containing protein [Candidatus Hydrogenedentes bacterium]|nr:DUF2330 domain-containing protein [Candidatus Hydrogenedentota bacterium]